MPPASTLARSVALTALLALAAAAASGCALFGVIAHKASGPVKHPAVHPLAKEPTLVLVERRANPGEAALDAQQVADEVTRLLRENNAAPTVDPGLAVEARSRRNADGSPLRPTEIARACGAAQMIYVDLTRYQASSAVAGEAVAGEVEAAVWVVDARTAQPRWPAESNQGYPVAAGVPFRPAASGAGGGGTEQSVREEMNRTLALRIARLFYLWVEE